jgi:hypothetical protein
MKNIAIIHSLKLKIARAGLQPRSLFKLMSLTRQTGFPSTRACFSLYWRKNLKLEAADRGAMPPPIFNLHLTPYFALHWRLDLPIFIENNAKPTAYHAGNKEKISAMSPLIAQRTIFQQLSLRTQQIATQANHTIKPTAAIMIAAENREAGRSAIRSGFRLDSDGNSSLRQSANPATGYFHSMLLFWPDRTIIRAGHDRPLTGKTDPNHLTEAVGFRVLSREFSVFNHDWQFLPALRVLHSKQSPIFRGATKYAEPKRLKAENISIQYFTTEKTGDTRFFVSDKRPNTTLHSIYQQQVHHKVPGFTFQMQNLPDNIQYRSIADISSLPRRQPEKSVSNQTNPLLSRRQLKPKARHIFAGLTYRTIGKQSGLALSAQRAFSDDSNDRMLASHAVPAILNWRKVSADAQNPYAAMAGNRLEDQKLYNQTANFAEHGQLEQLETKLIAQIRETARQELFSASTAERFAEDVMRKMDKRLRIERERRGI